MVLRASTVGEQGGSRCPPPPECGHASARQEIAFRDLETGPLPSDVDNEKLIRAMARAIRERDEVIDKLKLELDEQLRQRFGRRSEKVPKSEKKADETAPPEPPKDPGPLDTSPGPLPPPAADGESKPEWQDAASHPDLLPPGKKKRRGKGHGRTRPPKHLVRVPEIVDIPPAERFCKTCGRELREIGESVSERLEYKPSALFVIEQKRKTYACGDGTCPEPPRAATLPVAVVDKGKAGAGLLAYVVVSKFHDHLPLHRLRKILFRYGAVVAGSTLGDWAAQVATVLDPLYREFIAQILRSKVIGTDDTPVRVLDKSRDRTREGRIWGYLGDSRHPYVAFAFTPHRRGEAPQEFLKDYKGYLQADAYGGYDALYMQGLVMEVGCNAHMRRKFEKALAVDEPAARHALDTIRVLYDVEAAAVESTADERKALRQEKSRPVLDGFHGWLKAQEASALPKGALGTAVGYALRHWQALIRYLDDGELAIDNNALERLLRTVAVGRKNWLFFGSNHGGHLAAILYSVIQSAVRNDVEPLEYLFDVLMRIRTLPPDRIGELLPDRWKAARTAQGNETELIVPGESTGPPP